MLLDLLERDGVERKIARILHGRAAQRHAEVKRVSGQGGLAGWLAFFVELAIEHRPLVDHHHLSCTLTGEVVSSPPAMPAVGHRQGIAGAGLAQGQVGKDCDAVFDRLR